MGHGLAQLEDMAYLESQGLPWHKGGIAFPDGTSVFEMGKDIFNYEVSPQIIFTINSETGEVVPVPGSAIVRLDRNVTLAVMGERYTPFQAMEMLEVCGKIEEVTGATASTLGVLHDGRIQWVQLDLPNGDYNISGVDALKGKVLAFNSHDGSSAFTLQTTTTRVVCQNTLNAAIDGQKKTLYYQRHTSSFDALAAIDAVSLAVEQAKAVAEASEVLSLKLVSDAQLVAYVDSLFAPASMRSRSDIPNDVVALYEHILANPFDREDKEEISTRFKNLSAKVRQGFHGSPGAKLSTADGTAWGAVNAVTHYVDHVHGKDDDKRISNALFGLGAQIKTDAFMLAKTVF